MLQIQQQHLLLLSMWGLDQLQQHVQPKNHQRRNKLGRGPLHQALCFFFLLGTPQSCEVIDLFMMYAKLYGWMCAIWLNVYCMPKLNGCLCDVCARLYGLLGDVCAKLYGLLVDVCAVCQTEWLFVLCFIWQTLWSCVLYAKAYGTMLLCALVVLFRDMTWTFFQHWLNNIHNITQWQLCFQHNLVAFHHFNSIGTVQRCHMVPLHDPQKKLPNNIY